MRLAAVLADAGCGKTELAAQLTMAVDNRPAGIFLHGRDLHAGHSLDDLARRVVIQGTPVRSMEALVAAVNAAGQRADRRLPIVIDGLNEAEDPRNWKDQLASLTETLTEYPYVLLVATVRTAFANEALPGDAYRLEIPDFGHDIVEAIRRYFAHYQINAADAEVPWKMLQHPLTLRLFCEVTNPTRSGVVGVERMPGSLTALFDRYLEQVAERIAELAPRTQRYYVPDVREALNEIGVRLWGGKVRSLDVTELRHWLRDDARPWDASIVRALEQDGVALRVPGDTYGHGEVALVYDALAGHVVADALLTQYGRSGLEERLTDPAIISALGGSGPDRHPLATDILRALVGLLPRRLHGQQLWPLLNGPLRRDALRGAADLEGDYLDAATIDELRALATEPPAGFRDLFNRLWQTRAVPRHPLNADFLDAVLRPMSVADRDLRWSEWIRRHGDEVLTDLQRLEGRWRPHRKRSPADLYRARWVMWTLTSTNHLLRDQATRTLYWFGRGDPVAMFDLSLDALAINDPYVSERMLAACYGVAMARQYDISERANVANALNSGATRLYSALFAPGAPHATTHWLARNYARRMIEIAARVCPDMLSDQQLQRTRAPYEEGGIRDWCRSEDKNEGEYRDGNHPFDYFGDDPMGKLGPDISKYRADLPQYKEVKANLWWRIYDLGYSLERCGSVDRLLGSEHRRWGSGANSSSIDGYGRKYCWIATCELAGYRDDMGLLRREWESRNENWTHVDLDPSFPEELTKHHLVHGDLLGDHQISLAEWISHGQDFTFEEVYEVEEIEGEQGPWVLLHGYITQQDEQNGRHMFSFALGALVDSPDMGKIEEAGILTKRIEVNALHVPETHYTYAGEIPWCETYPANEPSPLWIVTGDPTATSEKLPIRDVYDDMHQSGSYVQATDTEDLVDAGNNAETIDGEFALGLHEEVGQKAPAPMENEHSEEHTHASRETALVLTMAVTVYGWESYHSELNPRSGAHVPARQIADVLRLTNRPQTFDLYDPEGRRASVSFEHGQDFSNRQDFVYLRKDLLDNYLETSGQRLIWVNHGERAIHHARLGGAQALDGDPPYVSYKQVRVYN